MQLKVLSQIIFKVFFSRNGTLSPEEARRLIEGVQEDMLSAKQKLDSEKERQEQALHKKLSERKKQKMGELVRNMGGKTKEQMKRRQKVQTHLNSNVCFTSGTVSNLALFSGGGNGKRWIRE